jgi:hypothetical protein
VAGCYRNDRPDAPEYAHIPKYREKKRERFLSQGELQRLGQVLAEVEAEGSETPFIVAAFRLLILTGCRLGEIQTLKWDYIKYGAHQVSIGRADFCIDILAPDFELTPDQVVIHSHSNRSVYLSQPSDLSSNGKSGRFTSVTAGKMPGRQVIIYDKRREVIDKNKPLWWDIWNAFLIPLVSGGITSPDHYDLL